MDNLGDDAEAFFRSGDEGTYEGGPASLAPLVGEEPTDGWDLHSADEWLERRTRLKRFVAAVVGGLSAGLLVLSVYLLGARGRGSEDAAPKGRSASVPLPAEPAQTLPAEPAMQTLPAQPAMQTLPAEPIGQRLAAEPIAQRLPSDANGTSAPAPSSPPLPRRVQMQSRVPGPRRIERETGRANAAATLPQGRVALPTASASFTLHAPPTATFPN